MHQSLLFRLGSKNPNCHHVSRRWAWIKARRRTVERLLSEAKRVQYGTEETRLKNYGRARQFWLLDRSSVSSENATQDRWSAQGALAEMAESAECLGGAG